MKLTIPCGGFDMSKARTIAFTGTRSGMTPQQQDTLRQLLLHYPSRDNFLHGNCKGADEQASDIAFDLRFFIAAYPCNRLYWQSNIAHYESLKYRPPYPDPLLRNHMMVDDADVLIATPRQDWEVLRSGTWATIRYARKQNKRVIIIKPNGELL